METFSFSFVTERRGNTRRIFLQLEKKLSRFNAIQTSLPFQNAYASIKKEHVL